MTFKTIYFMFQTLQTDEKDTSVKDMWQMKNRLHNFPFHCIF